MSETAGNSPSNGACSLFSLNVEPMKRLLLINFEKDPDEVYVGLEPQLFDDDVHGSGMRVVAWRRDGYVDVYQQPGLDTANRNFDVAGKGLLNLVVRPMEGAHFEITRSGVDVCFAFDDKMGRPIDVCIRESADKPPKPFSLLAPVGSGSASPSALPLFFLFGFDFVRKAHTELKILLDGKARKPDMLPVPLDGSVCYFMRYSADPFLINFSPARLRTPCSVDAAESANMSATNGSHTVNIGFEPPFPGLASIVDGAQAEGRFVISSDPSAGTVGGTYRIGRNGAHIGMELTPNGGWKPNERNLVIRFIYQVAPVFKTWPKSYVWNAQIVLNSETEAEITSSWRRIDAK